MKSIRFASFGLRGRIGDALSPEMVIDFACAFGTFADGGRVLVGRDTRLSSPMLHASVVAGLLSTGCEVLDCGVCPSPILQFSVERYKAAGAVCISGGHTRTGYNALTLIGAKGAYLEPVGGEVVLDIYHARDFRRCSWNQQGHLRTVNDFADPYFNAMVARLDSAAIRRAGFTVVVDPVNGAACKYLNPFADRLGIKLVSINADESGYMAHDPEPRPRNAKQASALIGYVKGDVGFLLSSDAGRVSLVCEDGETASEEFVFPLIARHVLARTPGVLVTNCCTTRMVDDVAAMSGSRVVKTPVGQAFIMAGLADEQGVIGGEGNGSVGLPSFSRAFDGFLSMGLILEAMAQSGRHASELLAEMPRYHIVKKQVYGEAHRCYRALEAIQRNEQWLNGGRLDLTDGVRTDWDDGWIHLRASQTEAMIRIISESKSRQLAADRASTAGRLLESAL